MKQIFLFVLLFALALPIVGCGAAVELFSDEIQKQNTLNTVQDLVESVQTQMIIDGLLLQGQRRLQKINSGELNGSPQAVPQSFQIRSYDDLKKKERMDVLLRELETTREKPASLTSWEYSPHVSKHFYSRKLREARELLYRMRYILTPDEQEEIRFRIQMMEFGIPKYYPD